MTYYTAMRRARLSNPEHLSLSRAGNGQALRYCIGIGATAHLVGHATITRKSDGRPGPRPRK